MHRQFFRIFSQNPDFVNSHCNDLDIAFHFECRKWYLDNQYPRNLYVIHKILV